MPKTPRPWIVTRHKPIQQLDDNLWSVHAELPGLSASSDFERVMHIIRLSDGRLAFHNAIPLEAEAMREVAALGKPCRRIARALELRRRGIHAWISVQIQLHPLVRSIEPEPRVEPVRVLARLVRGGRDGAAAGAASFLDAPPHHLPAVAAPADPRVDADG